MFFSLKTNHVKSQTRLFYYSPFLVFVADMFKTGILFTIILLELASGLPVDEVSEKEDNVELKTRGEGPSEIFEATPNTLIFFPPDDDAEDDDASDETLDNDDPTFESRFGFYAPRGRKPKPKSPFRHGAGKFPFTSFFEHPSKAGPPYDTWEYGPGFHRPHGFGSGSWNNGNGHGHGNKFGHNFGHDLGYPGRHYGNPWKRPSGFKDHPNFNGATGDGGRPWDGGFHTVARTTTEKTSTLPQIDIRMGVEQ